MVTENRLVVAERLGLADVSFYIEDKQGNIVYESDEWRSWDFKTLNIQPDLIATASDFGLFVFKHIAEVGFLEVEADLKLYCFSALNNL